jgi:two-component system, LytTR family, response regulator
MENEMIICTNKATTNNIILLPTNKGVEVVDVNTIMRIEASSNYSKLFFKDGTNLVVAKVLHWFEGQLAAGRFFRIHRTHFINKNFIQQYNNDGKVKLFNCEWINVSKRKRTFF